MLHSRTMKFRAISTTLACLIAVSTLTCTLAVSQAFAAHRCDRFLIPSVRSFDPVRPLRTIKTLRVGTLNLGDLISRQPRAKTKTKKRIEDLAFMLEELDYDIVAVQEADGLEKFAEENLDGRYIAVFPKWKDFHPDYLGFLIKRDLPFEYEIHSHRKDTYFEAATQKNEWLFTRDAPALLVFERGSPIYAKPLFIMMNAHLKSMRMSENPIVAKRDPHGEIKRGIEANRVAFLANDYRNQYGSPTPVLVGGDMNCEISNSSEIKPFHDQAGLTNSFDLMPNPAPKAQRPTFVSFSRDMPPVGTQLDGVFASSEFNGLVSSAKVFWGRDQNTGLERSPPNNYKNVLKRASDHAAIAVDFDLQALLKKTK